VALLSLVFYINHLPSYSYIGLALVVILFLYQFTLCKNRDETKCFKAFVHNNWVGMTVTASVACAFFIR